MRPGPLSGRRALVTGSSRNLGAEIVRSLARRGADVAVTYHSSAAQAHRLIDEIARAGAVGCALAVDLDDPAAPDAMVCQAQTGLRGPVDILVNGYGPFSMEPLHRIGEAEFARVLDGNLTSVLRVVQAVVPQMLAAGWGRILTVSAGSAQIHDHSVYGLAKAAVEHLTRSLAVELGPAITVNAVAPGQIEESTAEIADLDPAFVDRAVRRTPAARLVTRGEVAELLATMATPAFDMVTGTVLAMDGGWHLNRS